VAEEEILRVGRATGAPVFRLGRDFAPLPPEPLALALTGSHQRNNGAIAVALATTAATALGRAPMLTPATIAAGLAGVTWPGRLERIGDDVLLDCAHNPEGATALGAALPSLLSPAGSRRAALVLSVVAGKDLPGILAPLLPLFNVVVATASRNPRALPAGTLAAAIAATRPAAASKGVTAVTDSCEAVATARSLLQRHTDAGGSDQPPLIVVAGSVFLVGEVRAHVLGESADPRPVSDPV
jgi:dihydrofolate synthase/folylpolyglutamate synthase